MTNLEITKATRLKEIPSEDSLGFGRHFSDHMFVMDYQSEKGWHNPRIVPYEEVGFYPSTMAFHYGQAIFEGMKAFRNKQNEIVIFRTQDHITRLNRSAQIMSIPPVDTQAVYDYLHTLIAMEKHWVPGKLGTSLYIRPFIIAADPCVGVKVSDTYRLFIILSPSGVYYANGFSPVNIKVEDNYVRAVYGGLGEAKTPANYAASLKAQQEAKKSGFDQVLWLDAVERKYVEEVGTMNIFFKIKDELITPQLNGTILDGITRRSVIELAKTWGVKVSERVISIDEVYYAYESGQLEEAFGSGTAAVISPVGQLVWNGRKMVINENKVGDFTQKVFNYITGIQNGNIADQFGWIDRVTAL